MRPFIIQHTETQTVKSGAGLRISQIRTDDNKRNILYKTFKYGDGEIGYGFLNIIPSLENIQDYTRYQMFSEVTNGPISNGSYTITTTTNYLYNNKDLLARTSKNVSQSDTLITRSQIPVRFS